MKKFWKEYENCDYVTSAVTVTEYLTYTYQQNNVNMINAFNAFVDNNAAVACSKENPFCKKE